MTGVFMWNEANMWAELQQFGQGSDILNLQDFSISSKRLVDELQLYVNASVVGSIAISVVSLLLLLGRLMLSAPCTTSDHWRLARVILVFTTVFFNFFMIPHFLGAKAKLIFMPRFPARGMQSSALEMESDPGTRQPEDHPTGGLYSN